MGTEGKMFLSQVVPKTLEITPHIGPVALGEHLLLVQMRESLERGLKEATGLALTRKLTTPVSGNASIRKPMLFLKICSWKMTRAKYMCLNSDKVHSRSYHVLLSIRGDSSTWFFWIPISISLQLIFRTVKLMFAVRANKRPWLFVGYYYLVCVLVETPLDF